LPVYEHCLAGKATKLPLGNCLLVHYSLFIQAFVAQ
jgi:hypothetical protein